MISRWIALAAAMLLLSAAPALAETVREPQTGSPAVNFDAAAGWTVSHESASVQLEATDGSGFIQVGVVPKTDLPNGDFAAAAADLLAAIKAPPYSKREAIRYGGLTGEVFSTQAGAGDKTLDVRIYFLTVGPNDVMVATEMRRGGLSAEQLAAYAKVFSSLRAAKP